jgi:hypothetical protein
MDSGWAIVIGAAIALLGSVFAPWLKDTIDRRNRQLESNRSAVAASLQLIATATPAAALARLEMLRNDLDGERQATTHAAARLQITKLYEAQNSVFELGLLLTTKDAPIETMARMVVNAAQRDDFAVELHCFIRFAASWYRGDLSAEAALTLFRNDVVRYRDLRLGMGPLGEEVSKETTGS